MSLKFINKNNILENTAVVYTLGHGSRGLDAFLALLARASIARVIDVRAQPRSRRHPQYGGAALAAALRAAGIGYAWEGRALGGRRAPCAGASPHAALAAGALRAYADHMLTPGFQRALDGLLAAAARERTAILCAERLPRHCHRALIADALLARGAGVRHLIDGGEVLVHALPATARVADGRIVYDRCAQRALDLL